MGSFAAIFSSIDILFSNMNEAISRQFGTISKELGAIRNFVLFINNVQSQDSDDKLKICKKLMNVDFSYPNNQKLSLNNINLEIYPNETLAIVGENGAGKSTLVKLLLGLYQPTSGYIEYYDENYGEKTAIFQDHLDYAMTFRENIVISSIKEFKEKKFKYALRNSGLNFDKKKFYNGVDTLLAKEFGGIDLSGGEWHPLGLRIK